MADHEADRFFPDADSVGHGGDVGEQSGRVCGGWSAGADNPLVRLSRGSRAKVRTKLLFAFLCIAALLVLVSVLGVRVLGQANSRGDRLKTLQARAAGYQNLYTEASTFRDILGLCAGGGDLETWLNGGKSTGPVSQSSCLRSIDRVVGTALAGLGTATELRFEPASDERPYFRDVRSDYRSLSSLVTQINSSQRPSLRLHQRAENVADELKIAAQQLATQRRRKPMRSSRRTAARTRARGTSSSASQPAPSFSHCCLASFSPGR